jgi:hypothetical protein
MQAETLPLLRPAAEAFLSAMSDSERRRYVKKRRLEALELPGGEPTLARAPEATSNPAARLLSATKRLASKLGNPRKEPPK